MDGNPKQLIAQRIKSATNILVTVSRNSSVDELAAALGFTLMLNKMDKHATAVFSGEIPPAINFLEPTKTFESTVDSLRDFIIALDKEKADRLRYKVEDDVVRIFITPYRTTITQDDLDFSQGDFNVELIIALGVERKEDLDTAITAHGRILHDATVVTINAKQDKNSLGSIDWSDETASSLCEMLMSLSEALQSGLLDEQIASSLLTGIVAATERFSNTHTSPKVMTMAAQLMAAGANQQLIAAKLEEGHALPTSNSTAPIDGSTHLEEDTSQKIESTPAPKADGEMQIEHDASAMQSEPSPQSTPTNNTDDGLSAVEEAEELADEAEAERKDEESNNEDTLTSTPELPKPAAANLSVSDLQKDLEAATRDLDAAASAPLAGPPTEEATSPLIGKAKTSDWHGTTIEPPTMGGTLSATAGEAEEEKLAEQAGGLNHKILSHDKGDASRRSVNDSAAAGEPPSVDPFAEPLSYEETPLQPLGSKGLTLQPIDQPKQSDEPAPADLTSTFPMPEFNPPAEPQPSAAPTLAELEAQAHAHAPETPAIASSLDDARAAVDAALGDLSQPVPPQESTAPMADPVQNQNEQMLPPPPPMPDFSSLPPLPPLPTEPPIADLPSTPAIEPSPDQNSASTTPANPGQFKIPGQ